MIFNSIIYLLFLTLVVVMYYALPGKWRWICLLAASVAYYLSFIPVFVILIIALILLNFFLAGRLAKSGSNSTLWSFVTILVINLIVLAFFKYFSYIFPENHIQLYTVDTFYRVSPVERMILPLGLSYVVFTLISYQIEIKRKTIRHESHFGYFSLYVLFFPKIAQGPIERPQNLLPQFRQTHSFNYESFMEGLRMILLGYFKKLVVADRLAIYVNTAYDNQQYHNGTTLLLATVFFAFQIYADFSGYTDIAMGSAKLFGFSLTENFKRPYLSTSIKEFWERWHITFSTWLRDYIFLPLAYYLSHRFTNQKYLFVSADKMIYSASIMVTFLICGLWHGVGWNFLIWGGLFGAYLTLSNLTKAIQKDLRKKLGIKKKSGISLVFNILLTFSLVTFAWIFFRAQSMNEALGIIEKIFTAPGAVFYKPSELVFALISIISLAALDLKREYFDDTFSVLHNKQFIIRTTGVIVIIVMILMFGVLDGGQFIYFQF